MRRRSFGCLGTILGLGMATACASAPPRPAQPGVLPHTTAVAFDEHLALGLRLERLVVLVDGTILYMNAVPAERPTPHDLGRLALAPGVHTVRVLARASQPCGLFEEPRTTVTVRSSRTFRVGEDPAEVTVELFAGGATSDLGRLVAIGFRGEGVALDGTEPPKAREFVHARCEGAEATRGAFCEVEAFVSDAARWQGDTALRCTSDKLASMQRVRASQYEAFATVTDEGTTTREAMHAQLRSRYAEARIRELAAEARQCLGEDWAEGPPYAIQSACPATDSVASLNGW